MFTLTLFIAVVTGITGACILDTLLNKLQDKERPQYEIGTTQTAVQEPGKEQ